MKKNQSIQVFCKTNSIQKPRRTRAFIGILVLVVVAILLISYLGFDLKKIFTSEAVVKNFSYVWSFLKMVWDNFLVVPWNFFWNDLMKPLFEIMWKGFLMGVEGIKNANSN